MSSGPRLALIALNILGGLAFEALGAREGWQWAEPLVGIATLLHLGFYISRPPTIAGRTVPRHVLLGCLLLATGGELVLSAVLGLYRYRQSVLPAFVPPGHVLLFIAGLTVVDRARLGRLPQLAAAFAAPVLAVELWQGHDGLSLGLFAIWLACLAWGPEPKLYAAMFLLALGVELAGTSWGCWRWAEVMPHTGVTLANPPLAAGVFYALLDLLTLAVSGMLGRALARPRPVV